MTVVNVSRTALVALVAVAWLVLRPATADKVVAKPQLDAHRYDRVFLHDDGSFTVATALIMDDATDPDALIDGLFPGGLRPGEVGAAFDTFTSWAPGERVPLVVYNATGAPQGVDGLAALRAGIATWNSALGHTFRFHYTGTSEALPHGCTDETKIDGINVVAWAPLGDRILGSTCTHYRLPRLGTGPSRAVESDVRLNPDVAWSTASTTALHQWDLYSVVLHELGHFMGLDHSEDTAAVMFARLAAGTQKRTLAADDLAGLRSLYGDGTKPPDVGPRTNVRFIGSLAKDR